MRIIFQRKRQALFIFNKICTNVHSICIDPALFTPYNRYIAVGRVHKCTYGG